MPNSRKACVPHSGHCVRSGFHLRIAQMAAQQTFRAMRDQCNAATNALRERTRTPGIRRTSPSRARLTNSTTFLLAFETERDSVDERGAERTTIAPLELARHVDHEYRRQGQRGRPLCEAQVTDAAF